jgi:hypothetical protein
MHDVSHECRRGELICELATEEPEVGELGVDGFEVVEGEGVGDPAFLDVCEYFSFEDSDLLLCAGSLLLVFSDSPTAFEEIEHRIVAGHGIAGATDVVFVYGLEGCVGSVVGHKSYVWGNRDEDGEVEIEIATAGFLAF